LQENVLPWRVLEGEFVDELKTLNWCEGMVSDLEGESVTTVCEGMVSDLEGESVTTAGYWNEE
jgi:hypothetical protein